MSSQPTPVSVSGIWHNEHGSEIELTVLEGGRVAGRFRAGTGLARGGPASDLVGFTSGNLIAFAVDFGDLGSLTSWTGHVVTEGGVVCIHTNWTMCVELPRNDAEDLWRGTWVGADRFDPGPAPEAGTRKEPTRQPSHPMPDWP